MKGLLRKDFYMACKYCRSYLLIAVVFLATSLFGDNNMFFVFYPCMIAGMVPVSLLSYDENSKWHIYSGTLPVTRDQVVSAKYLMGLLTQGAVLVLTGIAQIARMYMADPHAGGVRWNEWGVTMGLMVILSCVSSSITLPFMFKWGVEKGRMAYYVMIGVACGGAAAAVSLTEILPGGELLSVPAEWGIGLLCLAAVGVYALSWYLSMVFYRKRELN